MKIVYLYSQAFKLTDWFLFFNFYLLKGTYEGYDFENGNWRCCCKFPWLRVLMSGTHVSVTTWYLCFRVLFLP